MCRKYEQKKQFFLMTNMSIQPLWLTYFIEILLVLEFQLTKTYFGTFSYKAHFRSQISSNEYQQFSTSLSSALSFHNHFASHQPLPYHYQVVTITSITVMSWMHCQCHQPVTVILLQLSSYYLATSLLTKLEQSSP